MAAISPPKISQIRFPKKLSILNRSLLSCQLNIEIHQFMKLAKAFVNILFSNFLQPCGTKFLYTKTGHRTANYNGGFHIFKRYIPGFCQMPDKATGKSVSCASR